MKRWHVVYAGGGTFVQYRLLGDGRVHREVHNRHGCVASRRIEAFALPPDVPMDVLVDNRNLDKERPL